MVTSEKSVNIGLLMLRIGIGVMFIMHGFPKLMGGTATWAKLGANMAHFGITFAPTFWGFMGAIAELGGGLGLIFGFCTRLWCFLLINTMVVAAMYHFKDPNETSPFNAASHAIEAGILFLSLLVIGPGKFSVDQFLCNRKSSKKQE